jgi:penicillin-binding protein 1A
MQKRKKRDYIENGNVDYSKKAKNKKVTIGIITFSSILIWISIFIYYVTKDLPSLEQLERYEPKLVSKVYSIDNQVIREISGEENRKLVTFDNLPKNLVNALIATEDHNFYNHWGVNSYNFFGALYINIRAMKWKRGFSTITMQLARNMTYLTREKLIIRKIKEILTALRIEKTYTKNEIIEMYFNQTDFGWMSFGIASTAYTYFSKNVEDLNLEECALLVAVLPAPTAYSPFRNMDFALKRRNIILNNMKKMDFITETEYQEIIQKPIVLKPGSRSSKDKAPYFSEYVRQLLDEKSNELGVNPYEDGLSIYTTLNMQFQEIAEKYLIEQLNEMQKILGPGVRRKYANENIDTTVQGAFVAIDPQNGYILSMVGGRDYNVSQFNRATQAKRQPGSAFKPFVWTAAIDNGYSPNTELLDQEVVLQMYDGTIWRPQNYDKKRGGLTTLREGLKRSLNNISNRIVLELVRSPNIVVEYAHNMGINSELRAVESISMGTSEVSLLELTSAFGVFPNNGVLVKPIAILKITDRFGKVIYEAVPEKKEVLCEETAYIMTNMLQSVMEPGGTGQTSRSIYGFDRPQAGKTGTSQEFTDSWFVGFIPQIIAGVWIGFDDPKITLGDRNSGAVVALPVWANFMKNVCNSLNIPVEDFVKPDGVVELEICNETKLIATKYCPNVIKEVFNRKYAPTEICPIHYPFTQKNQ